MIRLSQFETELESATTDGSLENKSSSKNVIDAWRAVGRYRLAYSIDETWVNKDEGILG